MSIRRIIRSNLAIFTIIIVGIAVRTLFSQINYMPPVAPDSIGYYVRAQQFYQNPTLSTFFSSTRTPVFPLILALPFLVHNQLDTPLTAGSTLLGIRDLISTQNIFSIIGGILFFYILIPLGFSYITRLTLSLIQVTNMLIVPWEWTVLTESWGVFWSVAYLAAFIALIKHPSFKTTFIFSGAVLFGIFLRPALLPLGIITPLITILLLHTWKDRVYIALSLVLIGGAVGCYTIGNGLIHHEYIFQSVSSINAMGRILVHNIPVTTTSQMTFGKRVIFYRNGGYTLDPFALIDNTMVTNTFNSDLQSFVTQTMLAAPLPTIQSILVDIPEAIFTISHGVVVNPLVVSGPTAQWLSLLQNFDQVVLSLSIIATPFLLLPLLRHRKRFPEKVIAIIGLSLLFVILPTLLYNYEDYPRFFAPYIPLYLVLFGYLLEGISKFCFIIIHHKR
jgi:hypothetical protein